MTTWKVRHEGSPQSIDGLSFEQVADGLRDGLWEPTDEVMGPEESNWVAIENHPQLAETAADIEPPPPPQHDDETRLDMNPLIDVALVLLVFFILTTTYETIRKVIDAPGTALQQDKNSSLPKIDAEKAKRMVKVKAYKENGKTTIEVEGQPVEEKDLERVLSRWISDQRNEVLIDAKDVEWGTLVAIQDAAKGAGAVKGHFLRGPSFSVTPPR
jgi:biopolymer transport protein ExbD